MYVLVRNVILNDLRMAVERRRRLIEWVLLNLNLCLDGERVGSKLDFWLLSGSLSFFLSKAFGRVLSAKANGHQEQTNSLSKLTAQELSTTQLACRISSECVFGLSAFQLASC